MILTSIKFFSKTQFMKIYIPQISIVNKKNNGKNK